MPSSKLGLSAEEIQNIQLFFPPEYNVLLFGSRINGAWREYSDLDICIKNQHFVDILAISLIREKFENSSLPFTVDIIDYHRCDSSFKKIIDQHNVNLKTLN